MDYLYVQVYNGGEIPAEKQLAGIYVTQSIGCDNSKLRMNRRLPFAANPGGFSDGGVDAGRLFYDPF